MVVEFYLREKGFVNVRFGPGMGICLLDTPVLQGYIRHCHSPSLILQNSIRESVGGVASCPLVSAHV